MQIYYDMTLGNSNGVIRKTNLDLEIVVCKLFLSAIGGMHFFTPEEARLRLIRSLVCLKSTLHGYRLQRLRGYKLEEHGAKNLYMRLKHRD